MTTDTEEPFLLPAQPELVALVARMRPSWNSAQFEAALSGACVAGWPWAKTFGVVCRLLQIADSGPHDLTAEVRDPRNRQAAPASAGLPSEYLAAKAALAQKVGGDHADAG